MQVTEITQIRLSAHAHTLNIEYGRYRNTEGVDKVWILCNLNDLEN